MAREDPLNLSAFVVESNRDVGYQASSTLAGTRLNTPLEDLGSPIQVITKEFLEDTGATMLSELLLYTTSTEAGGLEGNYSATVVDSIPVEDETRRSPDGSSRIRGLAAADRTRNYFLTDIPIDSYNIERVDISRGPNAILFGLGSPAGVANTTLMVPFYGRNAYTFQQRISGYDSFRVTADINQVIIPKKLAARISVLSKETHWQQNPTFDRGNRAFFAVKANPFRNTTITANYETGDMKSRRPLTISPQDRITPWFLAGKPKWDASRPAQSGVQTNPSMGPVTNPRFTLTSSVYTAPAFFGAWGLVYDANGQAPQGAGIQGQRTAAMTILPQQTAPARLDWFGVTTLGSFINGYGPQGMPVEVFDFRKQLVSGETGYSTQNIRGGNVTLEQHLFNRKVGIEVAYDKQEFRDFFYEAFGIQRPNSFQIDVNTTYIDGRVNPNYGRPFITDNDEAGMKFNHTERGSLRATVYATLNAGSYFKTGLGRWLGRHTATGFFSEQNYEQDRLVQKRGWGGDEAALQLNQSSILVGNRAITRLIYIGPSLLNLNSLSEAHLDFNLTATRARVGDQYDVTYWDRNSGTFRTGKFPVEGAYSEVFLQNQKTTSQAAVLQSYLLADNLVTVFGWRRDSVDTRTSSVFPRFANGGIDPARVTTNFVNPTISGEIKSYSVVGKLPAAVKLPFGARLSAHYATSENFQPIGGQVNIFGEAIEPPTGRTKEYGVSLSTNDNRASLRLNWYQTDLTNARTSDISGGTFNNVMLLEFQTAQLWYDGVNSQLTSVTQANIDRLTDTVPAGLKRLTGFKTITNPDGTKGVQYSIPSGGSIADITNLLAKGFETEITLNPTRSWRVALNVAQQQTRKTNTAPYLSRYVAERLPIWTELGALPRTPTLVGSQNFLFTANQLVVNSINSLRARDGVYAAELRKWRVNFVNNYTFDGQSRLKGYGVGGAWRWQDKAALSYPAILSSNGFSVPDIAHPYYTPATSSVDLWLSYQRPLFKGRVKWKAQINVGNLLADDRVIPASLNGDGTTALFRATAPRTWSFTSTFRL